MSQELRHDRQRIAWLGGGITVIGLAVLAASCGGGGGSDEDSATPTSITTASAHDAAVEASAYMPMCSTAATASMTGREGAQLVRTALALLQQRHQARVLDAPAPAGKRALALTSTKPADVLGSCGGRYSYNDYSHNDGITTATVVFTDFCTTDSSTGNQEVVNGSMSFTNTATPTDTGPISTKFEAATGSDGISALVRTTTGTTVSSETVKFSGLLYKVGVPGGDPTSTNPDTMAVGDIRVTDNVSRKTRRQSGFEMTSFDTPSGGSQVTFQARSYRSNGEYFDVTTSTPIVTDSTGNYTAGALTFTGSGGSTAVATLVPGKTLQATLTVNGTVDAGLPACK